MTIVDPADLCVECGAPWDDHTVADYRRHWPLTHPDRPYQPFDQPVLVPSERVADHVDIAAAVAEIPPQGRHALGTSHLPVIRWTFHHHGHERTVVDLILTDDDCRGLRALVSQAVDHALTRARKARR